MRRMAMTIATASLLLAAASPSHADSVAAARSAYARGDFVRAVRVLMPLALRGDARAQAMLGFMYENGFGTPQAYVVASDLYCQAAAAGNPFGQAMLGLMYDKGHGVPQDVVLAYKWLNLAAGHASPAQRSYYLRLRNAVASKMSSDQIAQGQALALSWMPGQL
ncbi:tetratricopeptide repeat protein [Bradyrhizobium sp. ORS 285]|nr:tetratricopeptide repeat protein [Bradyrhizobium sp. ORS 285]